MGRRPTRKVLKDQLFWLWTLDFGLFITVAHEPSALSKLGKIRWDGPLCPPTPWAARDGRPTGIQLLEEFFKAE
jgi:hypothetical protein